MNETKLEMQDAELEIVSGGEQSGDLQIVKFEACFDKEKGRFKVTWETVNAQSVELYIDSNLKVKSAYHEYVKSGKFNFTLSQEYHCFNLIAFNNSGGEAQAYCDCNVE